MRRYYGVRLSWLFTGDLTWRELGVLLHRLPMESQYRTEIRDLFTDEQLAEFAKSNDDPKHGPWSKQELLLARAVDNLAQLVYVQLARGGIKDLTPPDPVRTPGTVRGGKKADPAAVAYLSDIRARHANGTG